MDEKLKNLTIGEVLGGKDLKDVYFDFSDNELTLVKYSPQTGELVTAQELLDDCD